MELKPGMYVRCPIIIDDEDVSEPRAFGLAQVVAVDPLREMVTVSFHDPYQVRPFFDNVPSADTFSTSSITRCDIQRGSVIQSGTFTGSIVGKADALDVKGMKRYYVSFHSDEGAEVILLPESEIAAGFTQAYYSPLEQLKNYEFHNPVFFAGRATVTRLLSLLENSVEGFETLAGARALLLPHQLQTVVRCLSEGTCRYLLADEVGLGKTIEACSVLKAMYDRARSNFRAVIVVPDGMVDQWRNELSLKFNLYFSTWLGRGPFPSLTIVPLSHLSAAVKSKLGTQGWHLCVVDECHHLLASTDEYAAVQHLSGCVSNILLLSATPVRQTRKEYLGLLALLDPEYYGNMPPERFSELLERQGGIQREVRRLYQNVAGGTILEDPEYYGLEPLEEIATGVDDKVFSQLVAEARDLLARSDIEGFLSDLKTCLAYLGEHYRMERRVIRNRRESLKDQMPKRRLAVERYAMAGIAQGSYEHETYDSVMNSIEHLVANQVENSETSQRIILLLSTMFSSPWALLEALSTSVSTGLANLTSIKAAAQRWAASAERELGNLSDSLLWSSRLQGRLARVIAYLDKAHEGKYVVFTHFTPTLEHLKAAMLDRFGSDACAFFHKGMSTGDLILSADRFQADPNCRFILCDELGGEGRNFQNAYALLHVDLPWEAQVLEQRIGRLDRIGRDRDRDVLSVVFCAEDSVEEYLLRLWQDGLGLFHKPLSGFEIILGEINAILATHLANNPRYGLGHAEEEIIRIISRMKDAVDEELYLDIASLEYGNLSRQLQGTIRAFKANSDAGLLYQTMMAWADLTGFQTGDSNPSTWSVVFDQNNFSYRSAEKTLLIPPKWTDYVKYFAERQRRDIRGTFARDVAIQREDLLFFAPGDPVFDSIIHNAIGCAQGRACAVCFHTDFTWIGLVFLWSIQPDVEPLLELADDLSLMNRFRGFLPLHSLITPVGLSTKNDAIPTERLRDVVYSMSKHPKEDLVHLGKRSRSGDWLSRALKMGQPTLSWFRSTYPPEKWRPCVEVAYGRGLKSAVEQAEQSLDSHQLQQEMERLLYARLASDRYFGRPAQESEELAQQLSAVRKGLMEPHIALDSAAFVWAVKADA